MTTLTRLVLIWVLALTSLGLGTARGTLPAGERVVLCAGGTVTTIQLGPDGQPRRKTHVCPDMAPVFLAGWDALPVLPGRADGPAGRLTPARVIPPPALMRGTAQARGPPVQAAA